MLGLGFSGLQAEGCIDSARLDAETAGRKEGIGLAESANTAHLNVFEWDARGFVYPARCMIAAGKPASVNWVTTSSPTS